MDRDGTISQEKGYINHVARFALYPGAAAAIRKLNDAEMLAVVITNQAGVARGYFPFSLIPKVRDRMIELLQEEADAKVDGYYYCPHHKDGKVAPYNVPCNCRKPGTGLIDQAAEELGIDVKKSYMIGDKISDVYLAKAAGCKGILVLTGYGRGEKEYYSHTWKHQPDYIAENLSEAIDWILAQTEQHP